MVDYDCLPSAWIPVSSQNWKFWEFSKNKIVLWKVSILTSFNIKQHRPNSVSLNQVWLLHTRMDLVQPCLISHDLQIYIDIIDIMGLLITLTPPPTRYMDYTTCDEERVYSTATGMVWPLEVSRMVADMTAEDRWPGEILERQAVVQTLVYYYKK